MAEFRDGARNVMGADVRHPGVRPSAISKPRHPVNFCAELSARVEDESGWEGMAGPRILPRRRSAVGTNHYREMMR